MASDDFNFDPATYLGLEKLGRIRLSPSFHMREFLYSEVAIHHGLRNVPDTGRIAEAVHAGRQLCQLLLEPLQHTFGRLHVRSGYRSRSVNAMGAKYNCAADNDGIHTWDWASPKNGAGATACISIASVSRRVLEDGIDAYAIAWWIEDHLPDWSFVEFFSTRDFSDELCFNIGWHEKPMRRIQTWRGGSRDLSARMPPAAERTAIWTQLFSGRPSL